VPLVVLDMMEKTGLASLRDDSSSMSSADLNQVITGREDSAARTRDHRASSYVDLSLLGMDRNTSRAGHFLPPIISSTTSGTLFDAT